jgi:hypothetical protein
MAVYSGVPSYYRLGHGLAGSLCQIGFWRGSKRWGRKVRLVILLILGKA